MLHFSLCQYGILAGTLVYHYNLYEIKYTLTVYVKCNDTVTGILLRIVLFSRGSTKQHWLTCDVTQCLCAVFTSPYLFLVVLYQSEGHFSKVYMKYISVTRFDCCVGNSSVIESCFHYISFKNTQNSELINKLAKGDSWPHATCVRSTCISSNSPAWNVIQNVTEVP